MPGKKIFSWEISIIFASLVYFTIYSFYMLVLRYASSGPITFPAKPYPFVDFFVNYADFTSYLILATIIVVLIGSIASYFHLRKKKATRRWLLTMGTILLVIFFFYPFLPDIGHLLNPIASLRNYIQSADYYRNLGYLMLIYIAITLNLGTMLISVSAFKNLRKLLAGLSFLLVMVSIAFLFLAVNYYGVDTFFVPVLNSDIILNLTFNLLRFESILPFVSVLLLFLSSILDASAFFPIFKTHSE